jgi:hypothetical protein
MTRTSGLLAASTLVLLAACGGSGGGATTGTGGHGGAGTTASSSTGNDTGGGPPATSSSSTGTTSSSTGTGGGPPTAADLLAVLGTCNQASTGKYMTDSDSATATVAICKLNGAFYWQADMDVDCDGKQTTQCNINTDPAYQNQTSATDSQGNALDAANLPYVVIPLPSSKFSYKTAGFKLGDVVAVIYNGKLEYGVFGDEGPSDIIGEASYAMASSLGIDPDPSTGGTDSGVTYIAFPGSAAVVSPIEDHQKAVMLGEMLAAQLIANN